MPNVLLIIAQKDFQPKEYSDTKSELEKAGHKVKVASLSAETAVAKDGSKVKPDFAVEDVNVDDFAAVAVIGGPGALALANEEEVLGLIREFENHDKIIAAICISPVILALAGVLEGKKATVWNEDRKQSAVIEEHGAVYVDEPVVRDKKVITANGPSAAKDFGKAVAQALKEYHL